MLNKRLMYFLTIQIYEVLKFREWGIDDKLSKSMWFLIFEYQVVRAYCKRFLRKFIWIFWSLNSNSKNLDSERYLCFLFPRLRLSRTLPPLYHWPSTSFRVESATYKKNPYKVFITCLCTCPSLSFKISHLFIQRISSFINPLKILISQKTFLEHPSLSSLYS